LHLKDEPQKTLKEIEEYLPCEKSKEKYKKLYFTIIRRAKRAGRKKIPGKNYYEEHHILPKHKFYQFKRSKWNLVLLTAREHYICHKLLYKFTGIKYHSRCRNSHHYAYKQLLLVPSFNENLNPFELRRDLRKISVNDVIKKYSYYGIVSKRKLKYYLKMMGVRYHHL
jgi:hypothetical protein